MRVAILGNSGSGKSTLARSLVDRSNVASMDLDTVAWDPRHRRESSVAILDVVMPRLDGYEAAERIRALPSCRDTILIAVTAWCSREERGRSLAAGFSEHLVKPIDFDDLEAVIARMVSERIEP